MRKSKITHFCNKIVIWVSNEQELDGHHYTLGKKFHIKEASKINCYSFDTHFIFFRCVVLRNTFVQKSIVFWLVLKTVENVQQHNNNKFLYI